MKKEIKKDFKIWYIFLIIIIILLILGTVFFALFKNENNNIDNKITKTTNIVVKYYEIKFIDIDGTLIYEFNIKANDYVSEPIIPTKEGYEFVEWQSNGVSYDFTTPIDQDKILIACWKKLSPDVKQYKIIFNSDGGSKINTQYIEEGLNAVKPSNPVKEGFTFIEWQLNGKKFDFNSIINSDLILKAKYEKNKEVNTTISSIKTSITSKSSLKNTSSSKTTTKTSKSTTIITTTTMTTTTTTIAKEYKVIFDTDGGNDIEYQMVKNGNVINKPSNPEKTDYEFVEWQLNGQTYNFNQPISGNITLVAKWKKVNYKIGDIVTLGTEDFYVVRMSDVANEGKRMYLFAKYTLGTNYRQSTSVNNVKFSDSKGWAIAYKYINLENYPGPTLTYLTEYKKYLNSVTNNKIKSVTLMSIDFVNSLGCVATASGGGKYGYITLKRQAYWTSSSIKNSSDIAVVNGSSCTAVGSYGISYSSTSGVRPVVTISLNDL